MDATGLEAVARVNGVALNRAGEALPAEELRQRVCTELLRQAAQRAGLLDAADVATPDGVPSAAASGAIERLLEQALKVPEPGEDDCRRHYAAHAGSWRPGERLHARHILFAVTPGVDVAKLRARAEAALVELRCAEPGGDAFAVAARKLSNCPSGAGGGD